MIVVVIGVVIGLSFVFLLLSLVVTWIQEIIATLLKWRSKHLVNVIENLLDPSTKKLSGLRKLKEQWSEGAGSSTLSKIQTNFTKALYEHPVIQRLSKPNKRPSYIPSREFGIAIIDLLTKAGSDDSPVSKGIKSIEQGINKLQNEHTRNLLLSIVSSVEAKEKEVEKKIAACFKGIEDWFDSAMERASGWYKRKTQIVAIIVGIGVAVSFNVDAIRVTQELWTKAELRESIRETAVAYNQLENKEVVNVALKQLDELKEMELPVGWAEINQLEEKTALRHLVRILGWLLTGFAISQGAPIWFDILNSFVNMRGSGKKPETSKESKS